MVVDRGTAAEDADEHGYAHGGYQDSAGDAQPREHDVAGAWAAAAAGNVRRHHRLSMPGQRSVRRAQHEREKHRESADERREAPAD